MDWRAPKKDKPNCVNFLEEPLRFSTPRPRSSFGSYTMSLSSFGLFFYFCTDRKVGLVLAFLWSLSWVASQLSSMPLPVLLECSVPWNPKKFFGGITWSGVLMGKWETLEIQTERMRILNDYVPLVFYMEIWPIWPDVWWFIMIYIYVCVCRCTFNSFWIWCGQYLYN